tara:strand:- start:10694 stop:10876 length:183 start_codon:yes stop_codon:yes gene_type:complete
LAGKREKEKEKISNLDKIRAYLFVVFILLLRSKRRREEHVVVDAQEEEDTNADVILYVYI